MVKKSTIVGAVVSVAVVGIAAGGVGGYYLHPVEENLAAQKQCASDAQGFFQKWEADPSLSNEWSATITGSGGQTSYTSHYNASLNECLIEITGHENGTTPSEIVLPTGTSPNGLNINHLPSGTTIMPPVSFDLTWLYNVYDGTMLAYLNMDSNGNMAMCQFPAHDGDTGIQFPGLPLVGSNGSSSANYCDSQNEFENTVSAYMTH